MPKKPQRVQKPKVKSPEAKALTQSRRGGVQDRIPSGSAYVRKPKHGGWSE